MASRKSRNEMTDDMRLALFHDMLAAAVNMRLPKGFHTKMCEKYDVSLSTVRRIWDERKNATTSEWNCKSYSEKRAGN